MAPHGKMRGPVKPKSIRKTLLRLSGYMVKNTWLLLFVVLMVIVSAGASIAGTYFLKPLLNECILPLIGTSPTLAEFAPFLKMIATMAVIYLCGVLSTFGYSRTMIYITNGTLNRIRKDLFNRLQDLPIRYFDTHTHGELMSRFSSDVDTIREALSQGMTQLISATLTAVGTFTMMLILSPLLTILILLMLGVMFLVVKTIGKRSSAYYRAQQQAMGAANGYAEEAIEGMKVVKVFCHEEKVRKEYAEKNEALRDAATQANTFASIMMPIMGNLSYVNYALTAAAGALLVISGRMDLGTIASFLQFSRSFSQPITQISQQFNVVLHAIAGAERIFEVLDETPEEDEGYVTLVNTIEQLDGTITESEKHTGHWAWKHPHGDGTLTYTPLRGEVEFDDVTFGYEENKTVLHDIDIDAKPGEKIAFVGSTGAGKTTITNLINRFYDVPDGKIRYDGINIRKIKKDDLRKSLAMVLQDTHLFTGTVRDNIRYGKLDATDAEVEAAAKLANADGFIRHLPQGYDTMLSSDGTNLSQGQRQLLAIARAAIADPPVLILDEATSSIDTRTEKLIEKSMDRLMEGRTVFVIAHRLSTVRNADMILVLEHGQVIERGNHDELIAQHKKYYQLYTGQFELS